MLLFHFFPFYSAISIFSFNSLGAPPFSLPISNTHPLSSAAYLNLWFTPWTQSAIDTQSATSLGVLRACFDQDFIQPHSHQREVGNRSILMNPSFTSVQAVYYSQPPRRRLQELPWTLTSQSATSPPRAPSWAPGVVRKIKVFLACSDPNSAGCTSVSTIQWSWLESIWAKCLATTPYILSR